MRSPVALVAVLLVIALPSAGCGDANPTEEQVAPGAGSPSASDLDASTASAAVDQGEPGSSLTNPVAAEAAAQSLAAYVGKSPAEPVNGVDWNHNPTVVAGIRRSVTDSSVLEAVKDISGPSALIEMIDGKIASWSCENHNCGDHQWMVMVDPSSGATDVCYHDAAQLANKSRWFLANGRVEQRPGNCTIE